jgi:hypothetical protein
MLTEMITPWAGTDPAAVEGSIGLGIFFTDGPSGETCYTHGGYGGTRAISCPIVGVTATVAVQQQEAPADHYPDLLKAVFEAIE